jgi:hypothetical protein
MGGRLFSQRARRPFVPGVPRPAGPNIVHSLGTAGTTWMPCRRMMRCWPTRRGCSIGGLGNLEITNASDVLNDAGAYVIPDVHTEGAVRLGLHAQVPLDSSWPAGIYIPCCRVLSKVKNGP